MPSTAFALFAALAAMNDADATGASEYAYEFRETRLENGLKVVTLEDFTCPIVAVQVWYHVGSKDESADRNGFAHMFEHMMFRGTDRLGPTDHFDLIRGVGGSCNAYTSFDNTTYINVGPSNQLALLLWLEAERMAALKIDEGGFQTERRVVEEERRLGLNRPYGAVPEQVLPALFPGHPYSWSPIGNIPHLRAAAVDELQAFWERYYVPNNATLVIAGAVAHAEAQALAKEHFGWIPRCPDPPRVSPPKLRESAPFAIELKEKRGPVPVVAVGFYAAPAGHSDSAALEVLAGILGQGDSSRLHRRIVKEKKAAAFAFASLFQLEQAGLFGAFAALSPLGNTAKAIAALEEEIAAIREGGVSDRELLKARNNLLKSRVTARARVESKAQLLGTAATILGDTAEANREIAQIRAVTAEDVQRVAKTYLADARKGTLVVKPSLLGMIGTLLGAGAREKEPDEDSDSAPVNEAGKRAVASGPKVSAQRPPHLPERPPVAAPLRAIPPIAKVSRRLSTGLEVVVVPDRELPLVTLLLGLEYGASSEPSDRPGTASMACAMLTKGTRSRSADQIAEDLETYAIDVSGAAGHDSASVRVSAVSEELERAVANLAELVREPAFPAEELATLVRTLSAGKLVEEKEPGTIADRQFDRVVFGHHPYARPADGRARDLENLASEDLARWWKAHARPDAAVLYVAGDVDPERAFAVLEKHFAAWKAPKDGDAASTASTTSTTKPRIDPPPFPAPEKTRIYLVDHPRAYQSQIRIGHLAAITRKSSSYAASSVLNQVFGGSFGARLNTSLRVDKGLTYGIRGGFSAHRDGGAFEVSTFTKTAKTVEAVRAILAEIDRLLAEPPSDGELERARNFLTGSFARQRETPEGLLSHLWLVRSEGLAEDHFERYLEAVASASAEDAARVAREEVRREALAIVVVGDAKTVRAELEKVAEVVMVKEDEDGK